MNSIGFSLLIKVFYGFLQTLHRVRIGNLDQVDEIRHDWMSVVALAVTSRDEEHR